jgi:hypothetical protein
MEQDYTVSQVLAAGGVRSPSGKVEISLGVTFFRKGTIKAAPSDSLAWRATHDSAADEADVSISFSPVGEVLSLSLAEVTLKSPSGASVQPEKGRLADVLDSIARSLRSLVVDSENEGARMAEEVSAESRILLATRELVDAVEAAKPGHSGVTLVSEITSRVSKEINERTNGGGNPSTPR